VARTWLQLRVDLLGTAGSELDPAPGRVLIVGPGHTFEQLAEAINHAFARWDLSHLHEFELGDGRRVGFPSEEFAPGLVWEDQAALKVAREVGPGDEFSFTFDFGDGWRHRCRVLPDKADPREEYGPGPLPKRPVVTWGWGWIPDQYGRESAEDLELER
jgi:Plasmid pRiA4b ORF-3-like protein